ncbi:hypothetical protein NKH77_09535 [Streptomyces sp. M19]
MDDEQDCHVAGSVGRDAEHAEELERAVAGPLTTPGAGLTVSSTATPGYRDLMTREVSLWALVALASKAPVAMAPLAVVFLSRESPGGYTLGRCWPPRTYWGGGGRSAARDRAAPRPDAGAAVGRAGRGSACLRRPAARALRPSPVLIGLAFLAGAAPAACPAASASC